jgi:heptosyltransferase-2
MAPAVPRINPCGNLPPRPVPASVLIVKLAAIGDVAMALPMVTALRQRAPGARVAWLAGATVAPLLQAVEGVDEVLVVDDNAILSGTRARKMQAVLGAWRLLSGRSFDLVLTAHTDHRYKLLTARVRATERRWLGQRAPRPGLVPGRSFRAEYVRLVTGTDDRHAAVPAPPPVRVKLDDAVDARLAALPPGRRIALAPGGARNAARESPLRRWPLERYAALAAALVARGDTVIVTGGPGDDWVRPAFAGTPVVDAVGATSLPGLVALYAGCAAVVAHDSGPQHLAHLASTRVVGLFGPTSPAAFLREDERTVALWHAAGLPCAPCYDGREFADCSDNLCLQRIDVPDVLARLDTLLAA